ncbi:MAG TPA: tetratricopeptide repeat protein, partial [Gemmataceae bacterium]|nr:tetratricopeptide repeat protein [Gemmataceae bacterium]
WGIYPDTPKEILAMISEYRGADANTKANLLKTTFDKGGRNYQVVARLISAEDDSATRRQVFQVLAKPVEALLPHLLRKRQLDPLEDLLIIRLAGEPEWAVRDYAVFLLLSGRLDGAMPYYRAWAAHSGDNRAATVLAHLYRVKGDLAAARTAAEKAGDLSLVHSILYDQGDWKELSARADKLTGQDARPGFKAAFHRLAGRTEAFEREVAELQRVARSKPDDDGTIWWEAKALFLNSRPREALAVLNRGHEHRLEFEILCAQLKYREALAVLDRAVQKQPKVAVQTALRRAKLLHRLGEKETALKLLTQAEKDLETAKDADAQADLVEVAWQMGLQERALQRCATLLDRGPPVAPNETVPAHLKTPPDAFASSLLNRLFPDHDGRLPAWWKLLRLARPEENTLASLRRLHAVLGGKVKGEELTALVRTGRAAALKLLPNDREEWLNALAAVGTDAGRADLTRDCLESAAFPAGSAAAFLKLGNWLIEKERWKEAAEVFERARADYPEDAVFLYLSGWLLARTPGAEQKGKALMETARWLPLADDSRRHALATAMAERGLTKEARGEFELVLRCGRTHSWYAGDASRQLSKYVLGEKNYLEAATRWEQFYLRVMQDGSAFVEDEAYVYVPHRGHALRAQGLLAAGDTAGAWKEIETALSLLPGDAELPITLVPELLKRGEKRRADELFERVAELYERQCKEYPRDGGAHNAFAWLAARCRRQLDRAMGHAQEAVRLAPDSAGYLDTLAEVHFQRGEQAEALRLMRRCVELAPAREYYRRQLKRIEAGDPKVDVVE